MPRQAKAPTIFYGWFVVAACFAVTLTLGETFWSFGVFFKALENEFGWSRTLVSSSYTALLIGYGISVVASGRLADRYNPRFILLAAALLSGLGISLSSQVHSINELRIFLFIAGLGIGANWSIPAATVQSWFYNRHRAGLALGTVVAGIGVGALIFAPLINYFILSYGWRNAYAIVGIILFCLVVLASFVIKQAPMDARVALLEEEGTSKPVIVQGWTTGKALLTPSFIALVLVSSLGAIAFNAVSVHLIPRATDAGISPTTSAAALGLMGGLSVPGRIMSGWICDKIGWQKALALSNFGMMLSLSWLLFLTVPWMLYCFVFFYGMCLGISATAQVGILGGFFGMRSLGELIGINSAISQFVGAFAPFMAGFIFDVTGSYFIVIIIAMVFQLCNGFVAAAIKKPPITS